MKPGDLVTLSGESAMTWPPARVRSGSIGVIISVDLYFDQVSEPHGLADVLLNGEVFYGIPIEHLETLTEARCETG